MEERHVVDFEAEKKRIDCLSQSKGCGPLSSCLYPLFIDPPIYQKASHGQRANLLEIWSQRRQYGIVTQKEGKPSTCTLELLAERWNADINFGSDTMGESSIAITASLYQEGQDKRELIEAPDAKRRDMTRRLYAQEYSDYGSVLTRISHGNLREVFRNIASLLEPVLSSPLSATEGPEHSEKSLVDALFLAVVGETICNWTVPGLSPAIRDIFVHSMEAEHES
jgi:hypothetical protein